MAPPSCAAPNRKPPTAPVAGFTQPPGPQAPDEATRWGPTRANTVGTAEGSTLWRRMASSCSSTPCSHTRQHRHRVTPMHRGCTDNRSNQQSETLPM